MVEIESRDMKFKSYKSYAEFLRIENRKLQQLLSTDDIVNCYLGAKRDFINGKNKIL